MGWGIDHGERIQEEGRTFHTDSRDQPRGKQEALPPKGQCEAPRRRQGMVSVSARPYFDQLVEGLRRA